MAGRIVAAAWSRPGQAEVGQIHRPKCAKRPSGRSALGDEKNGLADAVEAAPIWLTQPLRMVGSDVVANQQSFGEAVQVPEIAQVTCEPAVKVGVMT